MICSQSGPCVDGLLVLSMTGVPVDGGCNGGGGGACDGGGSGGGGGGGRDGSGNDSCGSTRSPAEVAGIVIGVIGSVIAVAGSTVGIIAVYNKIKSD